MAGMFLSGDKTFMSFSVGDDDRRRGRDARLADRAAGRALASWATGSRRAGSRSCGRRPRAGESRVWGAILDRVLRQPARRGCRRRRRAASRWRVPTLSLHTAQTGIEGITSPAVEPFERHRSTPSPARPTPAVVAIKADDVTAPQVQAAVAELKRKALATGEMNAPINVETNRDGTVARVEIPLAGNGTDDASTARARDSARRRCCRRRSDGSTGVEYARHRADRELAGLQRGHRRARCRRCSASCCCSRSCSCSSPSARS